MQDDPSFTTSVKTRTLMIFLGEVFAAHFFTKDILSRHNLVVCGYGQKFSGKSTLFKPFFRPGYSLMEREDKILLQNIDFGKKVYAASKEALMKNHGISLPPPRHGEGKVFFLEHAPVPLLEQADIGIVIAYPKRPLIEETNHQFFDRSLAGFKSCAQELCQKSDQPSPLARLVGHMEDAKADASRPFDFDLNERVVRIFPISERPEIQAAFARFNNNARKCFISPR